MNIKNLIAGLNLFSFIQNIQKNSTWSWDSDSNDPLPQQKQYQSIKKVVIALAISFAFFITLWPWVSTEEIWRVLLGIDYFWVIVSALCYIFANLARTERFVALESKPVEKRRILLWIVCLHGFFNHILPMRLGELSFLYYSKKYRKMNWTHVSSYLLIARYLDLGALMSIIIVSALMSGIDEIKKWSGIIGIPCLIIWICVGFAGNLSSKYLTLLLIRKGRSKKKIKKKLLIGLAQVISGIRQIKKRTLIQSFFWSVATWLCIMMCLYSGLLATRNYFPLGKAILGASGAIIATLLPMNTIGTIGTYEVGWTIGYSSLGMPASEAVSTGIVVHLLLLMYTSILAIISRIGLIRTL